MFHIDLSSRKFRTRLCFNSRISILQGISGTGKTLLLSQLGSFPDGVTSDDGSLVEIIAATGSPQRHVVDLLESKSGCVFVFDENDMMLYDDCLVRYLKHTPNYLLIMAREPFAWLPYGVSDVFQLEGTPLDSKMVPRYILPQAVSTEVDTIVCADHGLQHMVLSTKFSGFRVQVRTAENKSKLGSVARNSKGKCAVVADWRDIGCYVHELFHLARLGIVDIVPCDSLEEEIVGSTKLFGARAGDLAMSHSQAYRIPSQEQAQTIALDAKFIDSFGICYSRESSGACADLVCTGEAEQGHRHINALGATPYDLREIYHALTPLSDRQHKEPIVSKMLLE